MFLPPPGTEGQAKAKPQRLRNYTPRGHAQKLQAALFKIKELRPNLVCLSSNRFCTHASAGRTASFSERHADLPMKRCHFSGNKRSPDISAE
jgi:hypothetical protein